jgi:hypothetical protein
LRRRIQSGELDLEQLGVKRLTVPRRVLEEMPLYTYPPEKGDIPTPENPGVQSLLEAQPVPESTAIDTTVDATEQHLKVLTDMGGWCPWSHFELLLRC